LVFFESQSSVFSAKWFKANYVISVVVGGLVNVGMSYWQWGSKEPRMHMYALGDNGTVNNLWIDVLITSFVLGFCCTALSTGAIKKAAVTFECLSWWDPFTEKTRVGVQEAGSLIYIHQSFLRRGPCACFPFLKYNLIFRSCGLALWFCVLYGGATIGIAAIACEYGDFCSIDSSVYMWLKGLWAAAETVLLYPLGKFNGVRNAFFTWG
jgi:hypothetical protein